QPGVSFFVTRMRWRRTTAVLVVYGLFLLLIIAAPALLTPMLLFQADALAVEFERLQRIFSEAAALPYLNFTLPANLEEMVARFLDPQEVFGVLGSASQNLAWGLIIFVTIYYFLLDWRRLAIFVINQAPPALQPDLLRLAGPIRAVWSAYLRGQLLLMLVIGFVTTLATAAIGLPGALLIGVLAGALDVIPSVGPAAAMLVGGAVALLEGSTYLPLSNPWFALLTLIVFGAIQTAENVWLRPRIFGQRLRLHPAVVFVAIIGALALAGVVAALVIVPTISTVEILGRYLYRRILGLPPWMPEESLGELPSATT
ncbi:MAG TPA: AI-2E family transporter, partial [Anaerolineales bacterium]|nr:AI-2E family transporter [Anaerolineales bacterium]